MTNSVLHLLHRAAQVADGLSMAALGNGKITARQQVVLLTITDLTEPSQTELVTATGIDRSTMADIVRRLCKEGLVARQRTRRDARRYAVRLTQKGEKIAQAAVHALSEAEREVMDRVPPKHRSGFVDALRSISNVETQRAIASGSQEPTAAGRRLARSRSKIANDK